MVNPESASEHLDGQVEQPLARIRRPRSVTILVLGVLIITTINLARFVLSIRYWDFLSTWPGVSPWYVMITGLIWTLAGLPLIWGLWRAKNWAPRLMQAVTLTYALYYWLDHVFLIDHPVSDAGGARQALLPINWKFAAGVTVVCLAFVAWTLNRAKVNKYFSVAEQNASKIEVNKNDNE